MHSLKIKRIYEDYDKNDGYRILVDKLWPRGVKKEDAHLDSWNKEIAPSTELRKWYNHDKDKFPLFKDRYEDELKNKPEEVGKILDILHEEKVTLLYGAKDPENNHAIVLRDYLNQNR